MKDEEYWDRWSKDYTGEYKELPLFVQWEFNTILSCIEIKNNSKVLDLGTGAGILIKMLGYRNKNASFIGIDTSEGQLEVARKECAGLNATFILGSMEQINLPDSSVDIVVSNAAIHHVKEKEKLFAEIYRVLKKGGVLAFADFYEDAGEKYRKEVENFRKKHPEEAEAFTKSIKESEAAIPEELVKSHPPEFHIDPYKLKKIIEHSGFRDVKLIKSFDAFVAVISAKK